MAEAAVYNFTELDNAAISRQHWKIMFISGMGFFTDAYDLFIIGVVMSLVKPIWSVGKVEESLVESTALLASAIGALLFGRVADMVGRKRIYGVEVLVLAAGAIGCAFSPNIWWLIGSAIHSRHRDWRRLSCLGDDHERICGKGIARLAGHAGFRDAGCGADPGAAVCFGAVGDSNFA